MPVKGKIKVHVYNMHQRSPTLSNAAKFCKQRQTTVSPCSCIEFSEVKQEPIQFKQYASSPVVSGWLCWFLSTVRWTVVVAWCNV